jgi:hypothetical protein
MAKTCYVKNAVGCGVACRRKEYTKNGKELTGKF